MTDHVVATFRHLYAQFWGPRTDDVLRATLLTLTRRPGLTLAEIPVCLTDPEWRRRLTADLPRHDPVLAGFWRSYDQQSDAAQAQITAPLLNKLRAFLLRREVRNVIGQPQTTFSLSRVLDHGGLLLARLPKGSLGEDTSRLLGALLVTRTWQHALARSRQPEHQRRDCGLYVDEVHNYLALPSSFEDLLAEARGYRLSLCLAHQHLSQLPKPLADALSANAARRSRSPAPPRTPAPSSATTPQTSPRMTSRAWDDITPPAARSPTASPLARSRSPPPRSWTATTSTPRGCATTASGNTAATHERSSSACAPAKYRKQGAPTDDPTPQPTRRPTAIRQTITCRTSHP